MERNHSQKGLVPSPHHPWPFAPPVDQLTYYPQRLVLISKAELLLEQLAKAHKIIPDNIKDRMDSDWATFRDFKSVTVNAREDAAVALCGVVKNQIENARRLSDSIDILKQIKNSKIDFSIINDDLDSAKKEILDLVKTFLNNWCKK